MPSLERALTAKEAECLRACKGGCDVYDSATARTLRRLSEPYPPLLLIVKPRAPPSDGARQQPYFGAMLTLRGKAKLREYDRQLRAKSKREATPKPLPSLVIECNTCLNVLRFPGALLFSPPAPETGLVAKYHICNACWHRVKGVAVSVDRRDKPR